VKSKKGFMILIFFILSVFSFAQEKVMEKSKEPVFRKVSWLMSRAQVKKVETAALKFENPKGLVYEDTFLGLDVSVIYTFQNDKLTRASYNFTDKHSDKTLFIDDFKTVQAKLIEKYGKPKNEKDAFWKNRLYKNDPSQYGTAISIGHLTYQSFWSFPEYTIYLGLNGDNHKISFNLVYLSKYFRVVQG
jgi:hypothetical protein